MLQEIAIMEYMKTSGIDITKLGIMATGEVAQYLGLTNSTVYKLTKNYNIPHVVTSTGLIFLKEDIDAFQLDRAEKLKHRKNK